MQDEIEVQIDKAVALASQQQGISFSSHREAQQHLEKTREQIRQSFLDSNAALIEGLTYLKDLNCGYVSALSAKLLKSMQSSKKLSKLIDQEILMNDQAAGQFIDVINTFFECGDTQTVQNAVVVLMRLFPSHPQPYIYLGTLIWRTDGITAAEMFYSALVETIEDPVLDYFAADCHYKNRNFGKAKELLLRAVNNTGESPDLYSDIRQLTVELLDQCLRENVSQ